jgi:hypothetical protein
LPLGYPPPWLPSTSWVFASDPWLVDMMKAVGFHLSLFIWVWGWSLQFLVWSLHKMMDTRNLTLTSRAVNFFCGLEEKPR